MKMKVGREPPRDLERVRAARKAVGRDCQLIVDANGAYSRKQALRFARAYEGEGVIWFEEPVVTTDLEGLRLVRDEAAMEITGGEYAYEAHDFRELIPVLDVLQADVTRCGGITGFLDAHALCARRSCRCPRTARRRSTSRWGVRCRPCGTSSGSTTTCASSACSSTERPSRSAERSGPTCRAPGWGWS